MIADEHDYYVVELSSFQLDDTYDFQPWIAVLLNITPDHLDRYGYSLESYAQAKLRIVRNQDSSGYFIYNADDENIQRYFKAALRPRAQNAFQPAPPPRRAPGRLLRRRSTCCALDLLPGYSQQNRAS